MNENTEIVENEPEQSVNTIRTAFVWAGSFLFVLAAVLLVIFILILRAPSNFPTNSSLEIVPGQSVREIVDLFAKENYIRSGDALHAILVLEHDATDVRAGLYEFSEPIGTREVARIITEVGPSEKLTTLTFPEGSTVTQMATIAETSLDDFNKNSFISYANQFEGKLFPDTYFVPEAFTDDQLFDLLRDTYEERMQPLRSVIADHPLGLTEDEVLTLASIIEREANTEPSMRLVSGVLQNRLAIDMPLQADASIEYILDKPLNELVPEDLQIESPYNTYLNLGLPPTPIGNPGLISIKAVLDPEPSSYFFYITDEDGVFHFAETFTEHNANIARYLR
ncbi:endolytic transglycosylase MltG [Candidatus Pacebacteria bacterium]|nr:endolytic transglycosylase MltG [Candidatus Paceibacterota bacterium]